jgi:hypothetical protein
MNETALKPKTKTKLSACGLSRVLVLGPVFFALMGFPTFGIGPLLLAES